MELVTDAVAALDEKKAAAFLESFRKRGGILVSTHEILRQNVSRMMEARPHNSALLTDLYELTMAAAYFADGLSVRASFELFVRSLPAERGFLIAAGLEQALDFLEHFRFHKDEIEFLRGQPVFRHIKPDFFDYLRSLRFTGEVWAIPERTPFLERSHF
jgi:nicotinic acid phosphoribosyltransferase